MKLKMFRKGAETRDANAAPALAVCYNHVFVDQPSYAHPGKIWVVINFDAAHVRDNLA